MDKISAVKARIETMRNILFVTFMLFITPSLASTITPINEDVLFTAGSGNLDDILVTTIKNVDSKISFNQLANFSVTRPLTIYNGVRKSDATDYSDAADTIFIAANSVALSSHIKIIGAPADLIIMSLSGTPITCNNCSFSNAGRVTLAHGTYNNSESIGDITARSSGSISITNLTAPGVVSLELMAETINISGIIDTNLKADIHPQGGMIIHEQGAKIVGSGGVNIYPGRTTIAYQNLEIKDTVSAGALNFSGSINAASISITSPNNITIPQNSKLNTLSDALSSSTRNDQFYAPLEGIFISTINNINASINISGSLTTDNSISIKSHKDVYLSSSNKTVTNKLELLAQGIVSTHGLIQSTSFDVAATEYRNTGNIQSQTVLVDTTQNIFNSYGGTIKANTVTLVSKAGSLINGSKSNLKNYDVTNVPLSIDLTALQWGVKANASTPGGSVTSNLSAHIIANKIYIDTLRLENINPYSLIQPDNISQSSSISVNNYDSNKVSIQAENELKIVARSYVLNSSAIIGLNQAGIFHLNTPKLSNERYHLKVDTFKFTQLSLSDDNSRQHDVITSGNTTKVTEYSPPGRIYSFGDVRFNHVTNGAKSEFINEFSYFEAFQNIYFYKADIRTLGLETGTTLTSTQLQAVKRCLMRNRCEQSSTTTSAEAETLFSIHGNVYGINPELPSLSDLVIDNINVLEAQIGIAVKDFLASFKYGTFSEFEYGYVKKSNVDNNSDTLFATVIECRHGEVNKGERYWDLNPTCTERSITQNITQLLNIISDDNGFNDTGYTYSQLRSAAKKYIEPLNFVNNFDNAPFYVIGQNAFKDKTFSTLTETNKEITIIYTERIEFSVQINPGHERDKTIKSFIVTKKIPLSTLVPFITQP